jgi:hypothetical protein
VRSGEWMAGDDSHEKNGTLGLVVETHNGPGVSIS